MAPVKFDDISKVASTILNDDFQVSGYVLKTKQKTNWYGTSVSSQVDLFADDKCSTPAKLTFALPKPFGFSYFVVNKLEMDKGGKFKLETTKDYLTKDMKVEVKSDLADASKIVLCNTYTGLKDARLAIEFQPWKGRGDFNAEATYEKGKAVFGTKFTSAILNGGLPDFGVRFLSGPYFCSLLATKNIGVYSFAGSYKATPEITVAVSGQATQKGVNSGSIGLVCKGIYKVKASDDGSVCFSAKHVLSAGVTVLGGLKYNTNKGSVSYGCQVSLE